MPGAADPYLPPRRQWRRANKTERAQRTADGIAAHAIKRTVLGISRNNRLAEFGWGRRLLELVECIQRAVQSDSLSFGPPKIRLLPKPRHGSAEQKTQFRAIATYDGIIDRVVLSQTAKYLRDCMDELFLDVSFAFRAKHGYSHTKAVHNIIEYRKKHIGKTLYVAECDISKFFDAIGHRVVSEVFRDLVERKAKGGVASVDPAAVRVVDAYLASYSFRDLVLESPDEDIQHRIRNDTVDQVDLKVLKKFYKEPKSERLGIPQGGALSPFLANCVLDAADRAVMCDGDSELLYARFCDDMILIHPDRKKCQAALERYLDAMARLKLPAHRVSHNIRYGREFFSEKSKGPYKWDQLSSGRRTMPWISFLGYQIRYDGEVRLRKQTIRKHFDRQKAEVSKAIRHFEVEGTRHKSACEKIFEKVRCRMIAMGVGRLSKRGHLPDVRQICWVDAFPLLTACQHSINQLRGLDKNRDRQLKRLKRVLGREESECQTDGAPQAVLAGQKTGGARPKMFFGKPFSYVGFLTKTVDVYIRFKKRVSAFDAYQP